jgi:hypothetical protein
MVASDPSLFCITHIDWPNKCDTVIPWIHFADAGLVFAGRTVTVQDARRHYGEDRFITAGHLAGRCVVLV